MALVLLILLLVVTVWTPLQVYLRLQRGARRPQATSTSHLHSIAKIPMPDPLGLCMVYRQLLARRENTFPSLLISFFDDAKGLGLDDTHTCSHRAINADIIYTRDPENIKAVLSASNDAFSLGAVRGRSLAPVLGHGLFTAQGSAWRLYRGCTRPLLSKQAQEESMHVLVDLMGRLWSSQCFQTDEGGWTQGLDLQELLCSVVFDTTIDLVFKGHAERSVSDHATRGAPDKTTFIRAFDAAARYAGARSGLGPLYWALHSAAFRRDCRTIRAYIDFHTARTRPDGSASRYRAVPRDPAGRPDPNVLRNRAQSFLAPARGGAGVLAAFILHHLAQDPALYRDLRLEVLARFGADDADAPLPPPNDLARCAALRRLLAEGLRLGSLIPVVPRGARRDVLLPRGGGPAGDAPVRVRRGTAVLLCFHAAHVRRDLWGVDAERFRPDRWRDQDRDRVGYFPFGAGKRQCIGQQTAVHQTMLIIVRFLQRFDAVELEGKDGGFLRRTDITTRFIYKSKIRFHRATGAEDTVQ